MNAPEGFEPLTGRGEFMDLIGPVYGRGEGEHRVHTEVERLGRKLAFADCSLRVEDREVVRARAVFALG